VHFQDLDKQAVTLAVVNLEMSTTISIFGDASLAVMKVTMEMARFVYV
jgi:hypothetical protein